MAANGFFNFLGGGRLTGVQALLFGSILSSFSAGFEGVINAVTGEGSTEGLGGVARVIDEKAGDGLLTDMALNAGRVEETTGGRVEAGGGGGTACTEPDFSSSGHAFAGAEPAAFPYKDPAEEMGAPNVGLEEIDTGGLEAGGGALFKAAISTFPTGV